MKHISPQLGFNNNVRHRGRVFHIQTEDSGIKHPHIITHLFADGGRILKTQKVSYAEFLGEEELAKKVRSLMQEQHKAMFMALRGANFDHLLGDVAPEAAKEGDAPPASSAPQGGVESRSPMNSLTGATDFAQTATITGEGPAVVFHAVEPPGALRATGNAMTEPAFAKVPQPPPSQPTGSSARLAALAAMDDAAPPRSRLTPPPPRATEGGSGQSPLRALASRAPIIDPTGRSASIPGAGAPRSSGRPLMPSSPGSVPPPPLRAGPSPVARPASIRPGALAAQGIAPLGALAAQGIAPLGALAAQGVAPPGALAAQGVAPRGALAAQGVAPPARPPQNPLAISASLDLDLEALERAAEQSQTPVYKQIRDLPPPPATLLRPSPPRNTSYRSVTPQATSIVADGRNHSDHGASAVDRPSGDRPSVPMGQRPAAGSRPGAAQPPSSRGAVGGRYAPSRPASIFGASRPAEGSSIFGEDLISEKSLDEVILSYLAEDLEGGGKK